MNREPKKETEFHQYLDCFVQETITYRTSIKDCYVADKAWLFKVERNPDNSPQTTLLKRGQRFDPPHRHVVNTVRYSISLGIRKFKLKPQ